MVTERTFETVQLLEGTLVLFKGFVFASLASLATLKLELFNSSLGRCEDTCNAHRYFSSI